MQLLLTHSQCSRALQQAHVHDVQTIVSLAKLKPWVIRGNASEIMALAGAAGTTRGVDSTAESSEALELGKQLALDLGTIVAISGKVDYVRLPFTCSSSAAKGCACWAT